jgi:hypothetical protein
MHPLRQTTLHLSQDECTWLVQSQHDQLLRPLAMLLRTLHEWDIQLYPETIQALRLHALAYTDRPLTRLTVHRHASASCMRALYYDQRFHDAIDQTLKIGKHELNLYFSAALEWHEHLVEEWAKKLAKNSQQASSFEEALALLHMPSNWTRALDFKTPQWQLGLLEVAHKACIQGALDVLGSGQQHLKLWIQHASKQGIQPIKNLPAVFGEHARAIILHINKIQNTFAIPQLHILTWPGSTSLLTLTYLLHRDAFNPNDPPLHYLLKPLLTVSTQHAPMHKTICETACIYVLQSLPLAPVAAYLWQYRTEMSDSAVAAFSHALDQLEPQDKNPLLGAIRKLLLKENHLPEFEALNAIRHVGLPSSLEDPDWTRHVVFDNGILCYSLNPERIPITLPLSLESIYAPI